MGMNLQPMIASSAGSPANRTVDVMALTAERVQDLERQQRDAANRRQANFTGNNNVQIDPTDALRFNLR